MRQMDNLTLDIINKLSVGIILADCKERIVIWNHWMEKKTGKKSEEMKGMLLSKACPKFSEEKYKKIIQNVLKTRQGRFLSGAIHGNFLDFYLESQNGEKSLQNVQVEHVLDHGRSYVLIQISDVTCYYKRVDHMRTLMKNLELENEEIRQAELEARELAEKDALTGLPNRLSLMKLLEGKIKAHGAGDPCFAVAYLDIDNFKYINDTYGHIGGDDLLVLTAKRLSAAVRASDFVSRLAGDEFVLVFDNIRSKNEIFQVAARILAQFSEPFEIGGESFSVTCSFGISVFPLDGSDPTTLIDKADVALYRVKKDKKAGFQFYSKLECSH